MRVITALRALENKRASIPEQNTGISPSNRWSCFELLQQISCKNSMSYKTEKSCSVFTESVPFVLRHQKTILACFPSSWPSISAVIPSPARAGRSYQQPPHGLLDFLDVIPSERFSRGTPASSGRAHPYSRRRKSRRYPSVVLQKCHPGWTFHHTTEQRMRSL